jgi:hypothetical protein
MHSAEDKRFLLVEHLLNGGYRYISAGTLDTITAEPLFMGKACRSVRR